MRSWLMRETAPTILVTALVLGLTAGTSGVGRVARHRGVASDTSAAPALGEVRGAFMALSVPDLAASRRWYVEKLGLRPTLEIPPANGAAVVVLEGGGLIVELVQLDSAVTRTRSAERMHGYFKSGVLIDDFPRALETLRRRGVEIAFGPYPARQRQRANVIVRDNAGNLIQLFGR